MKNWKTTIGGILLGAGQFIVPLLPPHLSWLSATLTGIGGLILGGAAKDAVTTTK